MQVFFHLVKENLIVNFIIKENSIINSLIKVILDMKYYFNLVIKNFEYYFIM